MFWKSKSYIGTLWIAMPWQNTSWDYCAIKSYYDMKTNTGTGLLNTGVKRCLIMNQIFVLLKALRKDIPFWNYKMKVIVKPVNFHLKIRNWIMLLNYMSSNSAGGLCVMKRNWIQRNAFQFQNIFWFLNTNIDLEYIYG